MPSTPPPTRQDGHILAYLFSSVPGHPLRQAAVSGQAFGVEGDMRALFAARLSRFAPPRRTGVRLNTGILRPPWKNPKSMDSPSLC